MSLIAVGGGGLFLASHLTETAWKVADNHTNRTAKMIGREVSYFLQLNHRSSNVLAKIPRIKSLFQAKNPATTNDINHFLEEYCFDVNASLCYVLDADGNAIATSNYLSSTSLIGHNYAFRPYFEQAINGLPATYLAVGVTTQKRGLYFSTPIVGNGRNPAGVAVVKYAAETLEHEYANLQGIFALLDPNGIVFASNRQDWLFRSLIDISAEAQKSIASSRQFANQQPQSVNLNTTTDGLLQTDDDSRYIIHQQLLAIPAGWKVAYLFDANNVSSHFNKGITDTPVRAMFGILFLIIGVIVVFLYNRATAEIAQRKKTELELRDSEEKYRLLFEKSEDPMWLIDGDVFFMANRAAATLLGYASPEELHNLHPSQLSPPEQEDGKSSQHKASQMIDLAYHNGYHRFEWLHRRKNGEIFPVEVSLTRIPFHNHNALFCVWRDITEYKHAQQALEAAKDQAEDANRAKSEFLSAMSHEIRTPMTGVIGFADMLLDDELPQSSRDKVQRLKGAAQALLTLINDILDLSKLEAGKMQVELIDFNLHELINDVMALFERTRKSDRPVDLSLQLGDDFPQTIKFDPTRLRQILVNLIGNAKKFTHEGSIVVRGELIDSDGRRPHISISIQDTGIGMSSETQAKLFSEFTQADASTSRKYEGSGLGLAICKKLVTLLDGDIQLHSEEGVGSTFIITFPYTAATSDITSLVRESSTATYHAGRPLKVLIAEDNRVNQLIVGKFMEKLGHAITIVENGAEAIAAHNDEAYDLILMDIRMPGMDGVEATRRIRRTAGDKANIPIIALTADAMKEHVELYLEAGIDHTVSKPYERNKLAHAINLVLDEEIHSTS